MAMAPRDHDIQSDKGIVTTSEHAEGLPNGVKHDEERVDHTQLKLDKHGVPMVPQPSDSPNDPLNWSYWRKAYAALLISALAFIAQGGAGVITPAFALLAADLHVTIQQASYSVTTYIIAAGVVPMVITPFANVYGRRPVYLFFTLVAAVANIGSGAASTYAGLIVGRVFYGIGGGVALALGPATISDMFPVGERGLWLGIYVFCVNNGPHVAPMFGGYLAVATSWRWTFYLPGMITAGLGLLAFFTLQETLFIRSDPTLIESSSSSYMRSLFEVKKRVRYSLSVSDFTRPFYMAQFLVVLIPAIYFATSNLFGSILFTVTAAKIAGQYYHFGPGATGLWLGAPITIGCLIGEATAGWVSDKLTNAHARRTGRHVPESRLWLAPLGLITNIGTITFGWVIQKNKPWIDSAVALAVAGAGLQYGSTAVYTYVTDSYRPQAAEVGAVINLVKSLFAFTAGYYSLPFAESAGFGVAFSVFAAINGASWLAFISMAYFGPKLRRAQGQPTTHRG